MNKTSIQLGTRFQSLGQHGEPIGESLVMGFADDGETLITVRNGITEPRVTGRIIQLLETGEYQKNDH